jgi:hypothetical protein
MASTMTHVITVVGFVLFIDFLNVRYAKFIKVGSKSIYITIKQDQVIIKIIASRNLTPNHKTICERFAVIDYCSFCGQKICAAGQATARFSSNL